MMNRRELLARISTFIASLTVGCDTKMGEYRTITQRTFLRGVNAAVDRFDQPRGSVSRISNLFSAVRGALKTIDGSKLLGDFGNSLAQVIDWLFYKFEGAAQGFYYGWFNSYSDHITTPLPVLTLTGINTAGGTLTPAVQYDFQIAATSYGDGLAANSGPVTLKGPVTSLVLPGGMNAIRVDWTGGIDAAGYILFIGTTDSLLKATIIGNVPGATLTFTDLTHAAVGAPFIIAVDSSLVSVIKKLGTGTIAKFPYAPFTSISDDTSYVLAPVTPSGGLIGNVSMTASIIAFAKKLIFIMGNGFPIYSYDGAAFTKISNTFTAQYPVWQGTVAWVLGDFVVPTVANTFYYKCVQAGTNGGVQPVWPLTIGQRVVDGQVIWENAGLISTSPAPRGAAFAIVHAGSLWVWNTYPTNTSDNIDGPSALRMSDVNNFTSWNPLNSAFVDKDDNTQGMGLATFTIAETGIAPIGSLVLFKNYSTYQVIGVFGSPNFSIPRVQTDMGCIAPNTILFVPGFGIIRFTHMGFAVFDGVRDRLISEEIRPYLFSTPTITDITAVPYDTVHVSSASLVSNPPMYICASKITTLSGSGDGATRIFAFDLVLRCWTVIDFPSFASDVTGSTYMGVLNQIKAVLSLPATTAYMTFEGGKLYRWFSGDAKWSTAADGSGGSNVSWAFTSPTVFSEPANRLYIRDLYVRGYNIDGNPLTVTIMLQGETGNPVVYATQSIDLGSKDFELKVDVGETVVSAYALFSGSGRVQIESLTWNVKDKPGNVPVRIT